MAKFRPLPRPSLHPNLVAGILLLGFLSPVALAKSSPRPISDMEIREKKQECYSDVESGMWGWKCRSSIIETENCALRCLSSVCYQLVYESDPLEEGENDFIRGQEFKFCMRKVSLGESLDGVKGSFDYF